MNRKRPRPPPPPDGKVLCLGSIEFTTREEALRHQREREAANPSIEQIILEWLRHNGHTWGTGPGSLIAELDARGYKIVRKDGQTSAKNL